ncbi:MAG: hypothetical protein P9M15_08420, partial [Candidatus Electryoneaceae bacterium]|nr:hypothetical protein [Candidatus Electryoneaceae bacterium]
GSSGGSYLRRLQLGKPSIEDAVNQALVKRKAEALTNLTWSHQYTNYYLFQTYKFNLQATAVKVVGGVSATDMSHPSLITPQFVISPIISPSSHRLTFAFSTGNIENNNDIESGFKGWTLNYRMVKPEKDIYFTPAFAFTSVGTHQSENFGWGQYSRDIKYRVLSLSYLVGYNPQAQLEELIEFPEGISILAEAGLGLFLTNRSVTGDWGGGHDISRFTQFRLFV